MKFTDLELMSITGHKSYNEFKKYIVLDNVKVLDKARYVVNNDLYKN